MNSAREWER